MSEIFDDLLNFRSGVDQRRTGLVEDKPKVKKSDLLLQNIESFGFNMSQMKEVITTRGNQLIISIAGSGKTTTVILKIIYDIVSGEATKSVEVNGSEIRVLDKIWVCTFLKSGAQELQSRLAYWQHKLGTLDTSKVIEFSTLHAEFKRALTAMGVKTDLIDMKKNSTNLKTVLAKYGVQSEGKPLNSETFRNFESAIIYTRNRLDDQRYNRDIYDELCLNGALIDSILAEWKSMRQSAGLLDFEDLQEMLYAECCINGNQEAIDFLADRYNYIYIDEFQDTSQIQYELLKIYASKVKKIVAIGDDDQTIYSWRGSYNRIITHEFGNDFPHTLSKLGINYRCPTNILKAIKPSIEMNKDRFDKELKSAKDGGLVRVGVYPSYRMMGEALSDLVHKDIANNRSVAILCRVNSDGLLPALALEMAEDVDFAISGEGMTLDSYIGKSILNIAKMFTDKYSPAVRAALSPLTWSKYSIDNLLNVCKNNRMSIWKIPLKDIQYSCPDLADILGVWRRCYDTYGELATLQIVLDYYKTEVYRKNNQYQYVCRSVIDSLNTLIEASNATTVADLLDEVDIINERLKGRRGKYKNKAVIISTVHEFKGKEADSVYVWNDSEDIFPHKNVDIRIESELEEERRVHYIACTRAKEISTILYLNNKVGQFVKEMDLSDVEWLTVDTSKSLKKVDMVVNKPKELENNTGNKLWDAFQYLDHIEFGDTMKLLSDVMLKTDYVKSEINVDYTKLNIIRDMVQGGLDEHGVVVGKGHMVDNAETAENLRQVAYWIKLNFPEWFKERGIMDSKSLKDNYKSCDVSVFMSIACFFVKGYEANQLLDYLGQDNITENVKGVFDKMFIGGVDNV